MNNRFFSRAVKKLRNSFINNTDYNEIKERPFTKHIPKIIHQIAINYTNLPEEITANIESLKVLNPNWEYRYYDDDAVHDYLAKYYPEVIDLYEKISPVYGAAKADFFRYLLLYNDGGVYLDLKSTMKKPLDDILKPEDTYLLSHWKNGAGEIHEGMGLHQVVKQHNPRGEFQQWFIISAKGHPFLKSVIDQVCNNIAHYNPILHHVGGWGVLNMTGPIAYTLAINKIKNQWPYRLVDNNENLDFVYSVYEMQGLEFRHHKKLKKHYTDNKAPIVMQPPIINSLYRLTVPVYTFLKKLKSV